MVFPLQNIEQLIGVSDIHFKGNDDGLSVLHVAVMKDFKPAVSLLLQVQVYNL